MATFQERCTCAQVRLLSVEDLFKTLEDQLNQLATEAGNLVDADRVEIATAAGEVSAKLSALHTLLAAKAQKQGVTTFSGGGPKVASP